MGSNLNPSSRHERFSAFSLSTTEGSRASFKEYLDQRWGQPWLVGVENAQFWQWVEANIQRLSQHPNHPSNHPLGQPTSGPVVLIAERDPFKFLAAFLAACNANCPIYLANPDWGTGEWQQVWQHYQPDCVFGIVAGGGVGLNPVPTPPAGTICIPTGGSAGRIKGVVHTWETLTAAVDGFRQHFQAGAISAYCVLPLYHVSGLMQAIRTFVSGGKLVVQPFKQLERGELLELPRSHAFISLVPTQLQRLLNSGENRVQWLCSFRAILLGGAPAWPTLLEQAKALHLPLALTYGMTETAAQVATLLPEEFLMGLTGSGRVLPHAQIEIRDEAGEALAPGQVGQIWIRARSLALNLSPTVEPVFQTGAPDFFCPDDLGYLDEQGYLFVVGRNSTKIITGGEKVFPEEVEAVLQATGLIEDICVVGLPDPLWGQAVIAVYVPKPGVTVEQLKGALSPQLTRYKQPKRWVAVSRLPRNLQGKINRKQVMQQVQ